MGAESRCFLSAGNSQQHCTTLKSPVNNESTLTEKPRDSQITLFKAYNTVDSAH